ncbi:MAG: hypothetical protein IH996_10255 [Proteobacteria bacterium]|nr:hypothetical protein [Pseudomonadota bacterium]
MASMKAVVIYEIAEAHKSGEEHRAFDKTVMVTREGLFAAISLAVLQTP